METSQKHIIVFFSVTILVLISKTQAQNHTKNDKVSAIYVFGDSTVDPGNNDYIDTVFKSNFPPYGKDFKNQVPTGRFTNGRLITDMISSYVGIKQYVPPYLDQSLGIDELLSGVSFASAGTGYDPLTASQINVISMSKQLEYFKELKKKLEAAIGTKGMNDHLKKAVFIVSAGTNDFVINYFVFLTRRQRFSISNYQQFVLQHAKNFIQGLLDQGAGKIGIVSLPPMGCLPAVITSNSNNALLNRNCIESYSSVSTNYNKLLQNEVKSISSNVASKIYYVDIYEPLTTIFHNGKIFGFDEVTIGCCGSGFAETGILCSLNSLHLCHDPSKYVFWDAIHPTEMGYYKIFQILKPVIDGIVND